MIENFVERIPESLKSKPGAPFYSGYCVKSKPNSPSAALGLERA